MSSPSSDRHLDWPYLLGRCFNLSVNLKILQGNQFNDSSTAGKCYADLNVLESQLDVHWLNVSQGCLADDLEKAVAEAKRVILMQQQVAASNTSAMSQSPEKSSLCLKPVRRLLKISPIRL